MNFSRIARQLNEENPALSVERASGEAALAGGDKQINKANDRKSRQKAQMATQRNTTQKSDVSYTSEDAKMDREYIKQLSEKASDWRTELNEAMGPDDDGNHPFVDVMPFMDQKMNELKKQMKAAELAKMEGGKQAKMAEGALNPFQIHFDKDGKEYTSRGSKEARERITRNRQEMAKRRAKDAYKPRAGESD